MDSRTYIAIDLKSFYASVECVDRGLDPLNTNLVVADISRTEKTICLAVSPALKTFGIPGRPRLFEVIQAVSRINAERRMRSPSKTLAGKSYDTEELTKNPELELDYIVAPPRMARYINYSTGVYDIYCHFVAPEHIHVYSIDESFLDVTDYLRAYGISARELAMKIINEVLAATGVTATAGIGTNLYLSKVAMDIVAKHMPPDANGVRIAELDETSYRQKLWDHRPLTDFWRIGRGYAKKLEARGLFTMGDIARCSLGKFTDFYNEDLLYNMFGINAELLIDHAWGWEPCTIADIKAYKPESSSIGSGQVLHTPYSFEKARLVMREMADQLALNLVGRNMVTNQIVISVGYDRESLVDPTRKNTYHIDIKEDFYGRAIPKHAHGSANLEQYTSSGRIIMAAASDLYDKLVNPNLLIRRLNITATHILEETDVPTQTFEQLDLFAAKNPTNEQQRNNLERENAMQKAVLAIKQKYGNNTILRGMSLQEGAIAKDRNSKIGGHKA